MEFWLKEIPIGNDMAIAIPQADEDRIGAAIEFTLRNETIGRLVDRWRISVLDLNTGAQASDREIDPSNYPAPHPQVSHDPHSS
jgi:hypothetical protein